MKKKHTLIKDGFEKRKLNKKEITKLFYIRKELEKYLEKKLKVKRLKLENLHKIRINKNFNDLSNGFFITDACVCGNSVSAPVWHSF